MAKIIDQNALKINVDEITSYKSFINNPQLIENKVLAVVRNDELMFYAVSPSLIKTLFKGNINKPNNEESDQKKKNISSQMS
jgi:hypothetical protein